MTNKLDNLPDEALVSELIEVDDQRADLDRRRKELAAEVIRRELTSDRFPIAITPEHERVNVDTSKLKATYPAIYAHCLKPPTRVAASVRTTRGKRGTSMKEAA